MPLDFALQMMRSNAKDVTREDKKWACATSMPFCHSRLATIEHGVKNETLDALQQMYVRVLERAQSGAAALMRQHGQQRKALAKAGA